MWFAISGLLALLSGWVSLSKRYAASGPIVGTRFRFASASMGLRFPSVNYGNCLFITTNDKGFHLSILFLFRFLSPPLFIPWTQFESIEKRRLLFIPYYVLRIREHWVRIVLYPRAGRSAKEAYDSAKAALAL